MLETKILGHPLSSKKVKIILLQRVSNSIFSIHTLLWISMSSLLDSKPALHCSTFLKILYHFKSYGWNSQVLLMFSAQPSQSLPGKNVICSKPLAIKTDTLFLLVYRYKLPLSPASFSFQHFRKNKTNYNARQRNFSFRQWYFMRQE